MANPTPDAAAQGRGRLIESRSIEWVPLDERGGSPKSLFSLWFMSNANITTLATGMLGAALGGSFAMSAVAILLGAAVGTVFTAFHSAQGPQLGLPQMIQSRAQFGYRGVAVICLIVVFSLVGFNMFNQMLGGEILVAVTHADVNVLWYFLISALALVLAIFGYHWIHRTQKWLTWLFLLTFGVLTVAAVVVVPLPAEQFGFSGFTWAAFLAQFGAAASYALGWAPYVSDYSRYLRPETKPGRALFYTYSGIFVGASWLMLLGAFVAAVFAGGDPIGAVRALADQVLPGSGTVLLLSALPGLVAVITVNIYAAAMELITVADSIRPVRPTRAVRLVATSVVALIAFVGSSVSTGEFLDNFSSFLVILLYVLVPWTSVNLVDYFFVRRGHYVISEIFRPNGLYGNWGWRGMTAYAVGLVAMIPFAVTAWYVGPVAEALGGADIALFVGLLVSGVVYLLLGRTIDREAEREAARADLAATGAQAVAFGRR
ncbi:cytosine permease [Leucobacter allii]|uniref:purine-cytosine permease family protein n=1 Tax=Leucobacter allii TaxID=2932247 RepID=UPI001FD1EDCE|nr:cytosine permease [Leucobacter allii]UOR02158.1 cytosine permease [Leucobacter allii]